MSLGFHTCGSGSPQNTVGSDGRDGTSQGLPELKGSLLCPVHPNQYWKGLTGLAAFLLRACIPISSSVQDVKLCPTQLQLLPEMRHITHRAAAYALTALLRSCVSISMHSTLHHDNSGEIHAWHMPCSFFDHSLPQLLMFSQT